MDLMKLGEENFIELSLLYITPTSNISSDIAQGLCANKNWHSNLRTVSKE